MKFSHKLNNLSHAEKHIFYYIDSSIHTVKDLSLTALADINNVSTTTIIRMCSKIGLSGYSELKHILKDLDKESTSISSGYHVSNIIDNLNQNLSNLNLTNINKLAKNIKSANRIIIVAVGLSKPIGEYFSKLLMQANKNSFYVYESHMIDLLDQTTEKQDLVIFVSNSGETRTLITACEKFRYKNLNTAAIINSPNSTLSMLVDIPINTCSQKLNISGYDTTPRSTILVIIDILFETYLNIIE
ncbi:MurR/RpiR family transcriptional regulator [Clostridioides difficile]|mgnify:CR=1 FL=1|uniref:MurR/RpiR family transcriptional regulator n=3 Tax=Clostridioides difficile TaxID=1496 RepID=A0A9P3U0Q2_CLODI|nr:MurR/RpiR family transcriptional regulator [Clostridioides difficile]AWH76396.1 MurR/RpiR family transcriptional regulator [Clostridioides difficile]AWH80172.1 MurR/RpiR family transcriptional regulator [Clostridioides difficile]AXU45260.1 phosphosugar-binding protein [Clostridioides difficile]AXU48964.1 phosphosugar-binding protein [Clostridioides difficile]AXU52476.1 phosphosugar-binding protein [Clostridioides difficile]